MRARLRAYLSFFALLLLIGSAVDACTPGGSLLSLAVATDPAGPLDDEEEDGDAETANTTQRDGELQKLKLSLPAPLLGEVKLKDLPVARVLAWHTPRRVERSLYLLIPSGTSAPLRLRI
jgi:hypothetical protein